MAIVVACRHLKHAAAKVREVNQRLVLCGHGLYPRVLHETYHPGTSMDTHVWVLYHRVKYDCQTAREYILYPWYCTYTSWNGWRNQLMQTYSQRRRSPSSHPHSLLPHHMMPSQAKARLKTFFFFTLSLKTKKVSHARLATISQQKKLFSLP